MPQVIIKVAGMEGPKAGKIRGRIKADDGRVFQISPVLAKMVNMGLSYDITYKDEEFNGSNGVIKYRVVESIIPAAMSAVGSQSATPTPAPARAYSPHQESGPNHKDEEIGCYAIMKCMTPIPVDPVAVTHAMKQAAIGLREFKKWQRNANIESGRQEVRDTEMPDEDFR